MSIIEQVNVDAFTILSQIGMASVFNYNIDRYRKNIGSKLIIKGSTNLKYITPPHLLTDPNYFLSHPKLKAGDLDLLMVMDNKFNEALANKEIKEFRNTLINNPLVTYAPSNRIGTGILQLENILSQYGFTIIIDDSIDELPNITLAAVEASIKHTYTLNDILNNNGLFEYYKANLIKRKVMVIQSVNKRKDNFFIKIMNKYTNLVQQLELLEITFLINKRIKQDVIPTLYYPPVEQVTPIYFDSNEWSQTHPGELYNQFLYAINNTGNDQASYLSLAYILHELHRLYNYSFGPYTSEPFYWKRHQVQVRIDYVLKLIKENQISRLFTSLDKTFMDAAHFNDLIRFLKNEYYDPVIKPTGDPFYNFEMDTPLVTPDDLASVDYDTIIANAQTMHNKPLITQMAADQQLFTDTLELFNDKTNIVGKAMLDYTIKNQFANEILSYTSSSSMYSAAMFGWLYTEHDNFLNTKINDGIIDMTAIKLHNSFVKLFAGLNSKYINKYLPSEYTLYKGVNLLNCRSTDGRYLRFGELDVSKQNYIYNAIPTSASADSSVASRFVYTECCLLRIRMQRKHKVYIVPDDMLVSSLMNESEYIFPPNSVFMVKSVNYIYHNQLDNYSYKPNSLVLVVDCDYMHTDDGDKIIGFKTLQHTIPLGDSYESISSNEVSANIAEFEFVPPIHPAHPAPQAKPPKSGNQPYSGHKKSDKQKPTNSQKYIKSKAQGGQQHGKSKAQGGQKHSKSKAQGGQQPHGGAAPAAANPLPITTLQNKSKTGKSTKPMSGGRVPITSYRKLVSYTKKSISKDKSLDKAKIDLPVTYSVFFIDNLFDDTCCNTNTQKSKSKSKMNKEQQKMQAEVHNIIQAAYAHPNAPNNKPMAPELMARAKTLDIEYAKYMAEIREFVAKYPQYSEMLLETSISRIVDTYESMIHLKAVMSKKSSRKSRSMKSVQVSAQKTMKQGKGSVFRPVIIGGDEQMALAAY